MKGSGVTKLGWNLQNMIEVVSLFVILTVFGYCGFKDFVSRTVPNKPFLILILAGITLQLLHQIDYPFLFTLPLCVLWYLLWRIGAFGGADMKAMICLSIGFPYGPAGNFLLFPVLCFAFGCLFGNIPLIYGIFQKQKIREIQIPFLFYLFFGILVSILLFP